MDKNGIVNDETSRRVNCACHIDKDKQSQALVLCGWDYRPDTNITIAAAMKKHIEHNQPKILHKTLIQPLSRDTVGDAFFSRLFLNYICKARKPEIVIVTSDYHTHRAKNIFEFVFHGYAKSISLHGCKLARSAHPNPQSEMNSISAFRKTFLGVRSGEMNAIHAAMKTAHPFYNGSVHPTISSIESIINQLQSLNLTT